MLSGKKACRYARRFIIAVGFSVQAIQQKSFQAIAQCSVYIVMNGVEQGIGTGEISCQIFIRMYDTALKVI